MVNQTRYATSTASSQAAYDEGLRKYMLRVYNYMTLGVALTGAVAWLLSSNVALLSATLSLKWALFLGVIGIGMLSNRIFFARNPMVGYVAFFAYAAAWGVLIAPWFYILEASQVINAFFMTSAMFASTSLFGYTTKRDLGPVGRFLTMAAFGLLAIVLMSWILPLFGINFFVLGSTFHTVLALGVILVFAGLTAYETQVIKQMYYQASSQGMANQFAVAGAFMLYGNFVTIFVWIMSLMGGNE